MNILIAYKHYPISMALYFKRAFRFLGFRVFSVGECTGNRIREWRSNPHFPHKYIDEPDISLNKPFWGKEVPRSATEILRMAEERGFKADILFQVGGLTLNGPYPIKQLFYGTDSHWFDYEVEKQIVDYFFIAHPGKYLRGGIWLPYGAYKGFKRTTDIVFVGVLSPERKKLLRKLSRSFNIRFKEGIIFDEYVEFYNQGKIGFVKTSRGDIPIRVFETMAMGNFLVMDKVYGMDQLFEEGKHFIAYAGEEELTDKTRYFLEHDEERLRIARAGRDLVNEKHRMVHRVLQMLKEAQCL
ncbi:MAG: glycosyltransferase [Candidatus Saganbacteria bacterium]|nr:glycosyltransferase [Candidatus Saganbacteria bacterium]